MSYPEFVETQGRYPTELTLAWQLADAADQITMSRFLASDLLVKTKPDLSPVTEADRAVELELSSRIASDYPGDLVAGEEFGGMTPGLVPTGRVWIIDPIDGTKNYVRGVPVWATLIALVQDGQPVVGMVSAPAMGRRWWAQAGGGAWMAAMFGASQPQRISVSNVAGLDSASFSYSDRVGWDEATRPGAFEALCSAVWRTRAYGDFYSHLLVAQGAVDVAAEPELNAWDVAALAPIVTEAGGKMTGLDGSNVLTAGSGLSTNGHLHDVVLSRLS